MYYVIPHNQPSWCNTPITRVRRYTSPTVQPGYIHSPLQRLGCGISCAFGAHGPRQARYECAFIACLPRNIMHLLEHMGQAWLPADISMPLHSVWAAGYYVPSEWMGRECLPEHISTPLHSSLAQEYHAPSECMGQECLPEHISTPLHSIMHVGRGISGAFRAHGTRVLARAYIYPPSQWLSPGISCTFGVHGPRVLARAYNHTPS